MYLARILPAVSRQAALMAACVVFIAPVSTAAEPSDGARLNRVIELFEAGRPAFGVFATNLSVRAGASISGSRLDFIIIDFEHSPYDLTQLQHYLLGMINKRRILEKGSLQPDVIPLVRVPSAGREQLLFVIKQVLDLGVFGLVVPHVDTAEDALAAVRATRFPQMRDAPDFQPEGLRGIGYGWPARSWGLTGAEYARRADIWPLDPKGEILLWLMIETKSAVENIEAIAATPGVSGLFIGPSDLAFSLGVPLGHPEVEVAIDKVLKAARAAGVKCGTLTSGTGVTRRLEQGFDFLAVGSDGGTSAGVQEALRLGAEFQKKSTAGSRTK
jgi:4-hydroxy-2-oxoheptanedioate aldolase